MALFLFQHQHTAETCPTKNPEMVQQLAKHTTRAEAERFGIKIHGDAVLPDKHTLVMVLEADSEAKVREYVQPFAMVGSVSVDVALDCQEVAIRGCGPVEAPA